MSGNPLPLLEVRDLGYRFTSGPGQAWAVRRASFELYPGEVVALVGESGSGKSTVLQCVAGRLHPQSGSVVYRDRSGLARTVASLSEKERRLLARTDWGYVEQHAADGLRLDVSAAANISERRISQGERNYARLHAEALDWMRRVELDGARMHDTPRHYSGGMRQRLQIARNLVTRPRLVLMDEPTTGLDVSVQARLLDLIRGLVSRMQLCALIVTHDLGVARLLAHRTLVMRHGEIIEQGLTDRVLDDPQHAYTQLLVSSAVLA